MYKTKTFSPLAAVFAGIATTALIALNDAMFAAQAVLVA